MKLTELQSKITPGKWTSRACPPIIECEMPEGHSVTVATFDDSYILSDDQMKANAMFANHAVNHFTALVEALESCLPLLELAYQAAPTGSELWSKYPAAWNQARSALAAAQEVEA